MRIALASHLKFDQDRTRTIRWSELSNLELVDVSDDSTENLSDLVPRLIASRPHLTGGASSPEDPLPFSVEYWSVALAERRGDDAHVRSLGLSTAYGIDADGRVRFADVRNLSVAELARALDDGVYWTSEHTVLITPITAVGGNGHGLSSLVLWLLQEFPLVLLGFGIDRAMIRRDNKTRAEIEQLAADWAGRHIDYPYALMAFVDTKTLWYPSALAERLAISVDQARRLLDALGYDPSPHDPDLLERSESDRALAARSEWEDAQLRITFTSLDELLSSDELRPDQPDYVEEVPSKNRLRVRARIALRRWLRPER